MVKMLLVCLGWLMAMCIFAQDSITKRSGEVIMCRIDKVDDHYVHFYELTDADHHTLYRMDVELIERIRFGKEGEPVIAKTQRAILPAFSSSSQTIIKTNLDSWFSGYWSLFLHRRTERFNFDIGVKYYDHELFMDESNYGYSIDVAYLYHLAEVRQNSTYYNALLLRVGGIMNKGETIDFFSSFNQMRRKYTEIGLSVQLVLDFQISRHFMVEGYFGLYATNEQETDFFTRRADVSGSSGIMTTFGARIGYVF